MSFLSKILKCFKSNIVIRDKKELTDVCGKINRAEHESKTSMEFTAEEFAVLRERIEELEKELYKAHEECRRASSRLQETIAENESKNLSEATISQRQYRLKAEIREKEKELQKLAEDINNFKKISILHAYRIQKEKVALYGEGNVNIDEAEILLSRCRDIVALNCTAEEIEKNIKTLRDTHTGLRENYLSDKKTYDSLCEQIKLYSNKLEYYENGLYEPLFDFDTSHQFEEEIISVRNQQEKMINDKKAIICNVMWAIEGDQRKGIKMTERIMKLSLRAFNNECDAIIAKVKWNNIIKMRKKMAESFNTINKLNEETKIFITEEYLNLKLKELSLNYEYKEKKQQEKEEQKILIQKQKEEEQLEKDMLKAQKEEEKYSRLLDKARKESRILDGAELSILTEKIKQLEKELTEIQEKKQRALSMAQQTRVGYVYVLSNIGSFGHDVYKIGMTRRLEPMDRVNELSDASVPFRFDVHTIIFSEDAPGLEKALHKIFESKRINAVNYRKEFFKTDLSHIESEIKKLFPNAEINKKIEAREYNQSIAYHMQNDENKKNTESLKFRDEL